MTLLYTQLQYRVTSNRHFLAEIMSGNFMLTDKDYLSRSLVLDAVPDDLVLQNANFHTSNILTDILSTQDPKL